jgi:hypothetical protein
MNLRLKQTELATLQIEAKLSRNYYRLVAPTSVEHELRRQFGHPSSYAFVRFECVPGDELIFEAVASWPESVSPSYGAALDRMIAEGVADGLLDDVYPHSGCTVTLVETRYDEIGSSEAAFLWAATRAMTTLKEGKWNLITKPHQ